MAEFDAGVARTVVDVVDQLCTLGLEGGDTVLVHTSFRAVRPIEGGPKGLIEAISRCIGEAGTLVMPSWAADDDHLFDPTTTPVAPDLGAVANVFWQLLGVQRGPHPFAFAARGPRAAEVLSDDMPIPPHRFESSVGRVVDCDGKILLLGVGHASNSTLHLVEHLVGVPYRIPHHVTILRDGVPTRLDYAETDSCCALFDLADGWLKEAGKQMEGVVGHGLAKLICARDLVDTVIPHLQRDPLLFLHPVQSDCEECALAWQSIAELS